MDILIVFLTIIALSISIISVFGGYKLFMIFLPFINLVFGFLITVEAFEMIFGGNAYESVVAIVVAIIVGIIFAILSYFFTLWPLAKQQE